MRGWSHFRRIERDTLRRVAPEIPCVQAKNAGDFDWTAANSSNLAQIPQISWKCRELTGNLAILREPTVESET
jgi:hypothetical protein